MGARHKSFYRWLLWDPWTAKSHESDFGISTSPSLLVFTRFSTQDIWWTFLPLTTIVISLLTAVRVIFSRLFEFFFTARVNIRASLTIWWTFDRLYSSSLACESPTRNTYHKIIVAAMDFFCWIPPMSHAEAGGGVNSVVLDIQQVKKEIWSHNAVIGPEIFWSHEKTMLYELITISDLCIVKRNCFFRVKMQFCRFSWPFTLAYLTFCQFLW